MHRLFFKSTYYFALFCFFINALECMDTDFAAAAKKRLAEQLYDAGAIKVGEFTLKSGIISPIYIDLRVIISHPEILKDTADLIGTVIKGLPNNERTVICGVPYSALSIAAVVAVLHDQPMIMHRKEAKSYGTKKMVEGDFAPGDNCIVIEDVITTGGSVQETINILHNEGLVVKDIVVIVDREQGGKQRLSQDNYTVHSLFTITGLMQDLYASGKLERSMYEQCQSWINEHKIHD